MAPVPALRSRSEKCLLPFSSPLFHTPLMHCTASSTEKEHQWIFTKLYETQIVLIAFVL